MKLLKNIIRLALVGGIATGTYFYVIHAQPQDPSAGKRGKGGNTGPVAILAAPAHTANVPVFLSGIGTAKARNTVTVRPQVDGKLLSVNFKEGQDVKKGDVLAKIDPITYQAQLDQALAKKALDEAQLANTKRDLARFEKVGTLAISQQQIDTQRALGAQQEAQIKSDTAAIENLTAILGYTKVLAPIDGRTGLRLVDEGNLVRAGETGGIVVITEVRPISVIFTLPQQALPQLSKAVAGGSLTAEAYTTDGHSLLDTGALQVVDNQVDAQTGTVRLKAEFPNERLQLWPGQFVNVRLLIDTLANAVVAPVAAVQRGPNGPFVFVVGGDETVAMRSVKIAQQDEKDAVFSEGLKPGELVVTTGFGRLEEGSKVKLGDGQPVAAEPLATGALQGRTTAADAQAAPVETNRLATGSPAGASTPGWALL